MVGEDHPLNFELITALVEQEGGQVLTAPSAVRNGGLRNVGRP